MNIIFDLMVLLVTLFTTITILYDLTKVYSYLHILIIVVMVSKLCIIIIHITVNLNFYVYGTLFGKPGSSI